MATFRFEAKDKTGNAVNGVIDALDERGTASALREQGLFPLRIEAIGASAVAAPISTFNFPTNNSPNSPFGNPAAGNAVLGAPVTVESQNAAYGIYNGNDTAKKDIAPFLVSVPLDSLAMMYRQMATLMDSGVPMVQALSALTEQTGNPRLKSILRESIQAVSNGYPLSAVMQRHPSVFTVIQLELVRAGEASGLLSLMCSRIALYLEREIAIRRKINQETLYPKIVFFVAGLVVLLIGGLKAGLGDVYQKLIFAALVAATGFAIFWFTRYANQYPQIAALFDNIKLLIPGAGAVARRYATARFARALSSLYGGGVLLHRAVEIAARAAGNKAIANSVLAHIPALQNGEGISTMLARSGLLSPIAVQMARTGEQTGNLDGMMDKVADYLEQEADVKAHRQAVMTGVFALFLAALVVLYVAVSFYGGMFSSIMNGAEKGG